MAPSLRFTNAFGHSTRTARLECLQNQCRNFLGASIHSWSPIPGGEGDEPHHVVPCCWKVTSMHVLSEGPVRIKNARDQKYMFSLIHLMALLYLSAPNASVVWIKPLANQFVRTALDLS